MRDVSDDTHSLEATLAQVSYVGSVGSGLGGKVGRIVGVGVGVVSVGLAVVVTSVGATVVVPSVGLAVVVTSVGVAVVPLVVLPVVVVPAVVV